MSPVVKLNGWKITSRTPRMHRNLSQDISMGAVRDEVESVMRSLPEGSTLEDVQYGLYVVEKIKRGLADAEEGRTLTQEEVEKRFAKWLID